MPHDYILRKIDDALWKQVKIKAATEGVTVREKLEELLKLWTSGKGKRD